MNYMEEESIDFKEVCKIYQALTINNALLTDEFKSKVFDNYILKVFHSAKLVDGF